MVKVTNNDVQRAINQFYEPPSNDLPILVSETSASNSLIRYQATPEVEGDPQLPYPKASDIDWTALVCYCRYSNKLILKG